MEIRPFTDEPIRALAYDGSPVQNIDSLGLSKDDLFKIYRWLVFVRAVDDRGYILVRQGRAGFYAQIAGQEALQVGSALPLLKDDWMYGDHRSQGSMLVKGLRASEWFAHVLGRMLDPTQGRLMPHGPGRRDLHIVPPSSTVGNQITEAVGTAMAQRIKKRKELTITYFGDGATSEGDFHVGLNFAAVYASPCIFFCQNNQYAISVPLRDQTRASSIAQRAAGYGTVHPEEARETRVLGVLGTVVHDEERRVEPGWVGSRVEEHVHAGNEAAAADLEPFDRPCVCDRLEPGR